MQDVVRINKLDQFKDVLPPEVRNQSSRVCIAYHVYICTRACCVDIGVACVSYARVLRGWVDYLLVPQDKRNGVSGYHRSAPLPAMSQQVIVRIQHYSNQQPSPNITAMNSPHPTL